MFSDLPKISGNPARGLFISFEGSEGCGKSTQIERIAAKLESLGYPVKTTREPGGTAAGEEIRHLLKFSPAGRALTPEAELLLFTASRAQLVREIIAPALHAGTCVLADRFLDSTAVYQGVARRLDPGIVATINHFAVGDCRPDLTFVLDLDPETARRRLLRRPRPVGEEHDRMEQQAAEFFLAVREGYLALARREPERVRLIDGAKSLADVEGALWAHIEQTLAHRAIAGKGNQTTTPGSP